MRERYTITERLDQGGMAEVFRGVAEGIEGFKKAVAIKRILPNLTKNQKFVSMFLDEARLSLFLQHANIVAVFDISKTADNAYFLVMEYVDGCNLKALMERQKAKNKRIDTGLAIYLMNECCKALSYAHHLEHPETGQPLGIVHRDISPPNILLSKNGEVKLVDFGLAKANSQIESTDPGVVKGKFSYLSPEAASGLEVDARADVFAVGIILWEMFTGRRLFYGDTDYQTVELVRQARVPSLQALNPEIDAELEAIVRKALARDPAERYQHAEDLGEALIQYQVSKRLSVTARQIAALVREAQMELMRKRSSDPKESLIDALINDEVQRLTSLIAEDSPAAANDPSAASNRDKIDGAAMLDPANFINTKDWADELRAEPSGRGARGPAAPPPPRSPGPRPSVPPIAESTDDLSTMLEPERTGLHDLPRGNGKLIAIVIAIMLAVGAVFAATQLL